MHVDKSTHQWKSLPLRVRIGMIGLSSRKRAKLLEYFSASVGILGLFSFMWMTSLAKLSICLFFFGAYWLSHSLSYIDKKDMWLSK
jgi:hypothetical protein